MPSANACRVEILTFESLIPKHAQQNSPDVAITYFEACVEVTLKNNSVPDSIVRKKKRSFKKV